MFTGIVQSIGTLKTKEPFRNGFLFGTQTNASLLKKLKIGSSISVSGVCLTVRNKKGNLFFAEVMPETLKKTTLGEKKIGDRLNVEPSLRVGDDVAGHFVFGHVDAPIYLREKKTEKGNIALVFAIPAQFHHLIALCGSVCLDGVSLTVSHRTKKTCTVSLIEFTAKHTTLGNLKKGDAVNFEADMLARYTHGFFCHSEFRHTAGRRIPF
ncbi:MAG TPA: riboflavin synthase [Candidatus Magasanikbacteria bacterium]|nr:MAG: riboflavin synthase subunit alpha [Candidatus Magasanikbacteria bacterium RIFCSPLOWO2_02_FULL_47_16]OGH80099.1 MAG: riboflavin synthase subunit alpha [Candidatus Magasanikbacteria bacterium RIFCSPHIGHO2_02_FULL_48_18]OGH83316.1 MAG: riboflavin synthase subunit alpha [Candidatus Magasanikbacteria bacterium RIFCSPLOWO2_12_FULL_47_9b]HAZ28927.1 riboflavin synthase [Candidatus Magasanikbacteria bacterium]